MKGIDKYIKPWPCIEMSCNSTFSSSSFGILLKPDSLGGLAKVTCRNPVLVASGSGPAGTLSLWHQALAGSKLTLIFFSPQQAHGYVCDLRFEL
jgi:hypothetical protein